MRTKILILLIMTMIGNTAYAACSTAQIAGDYALMINWSDAGQDGFISGKLEINTGGRAVLRGAQLTYKDGASLINREGSATGKIGVAPLCIGELQLSFVHRESNSEVANISTTLVVGGDRFAPLIQGAAAIDIKNPAPNNVSYKRNLLGQMSLQKTNF